MPPYNFAESINHNDKSYSPQMTFQREPSFFIAAAQYTFDLLQQGKYVIICQWLTHYGRVTHICVCKLTIIGSNNGLSPGRRQAIIWINAGILLIEPLGTKFSEILIEILTFSFKKMCLIVSSAKWRPYCLGLNVLTKISAKEITLLMPPYHFPFPYATMIIIIYTNDMSAPANIVHLLCATYVRSQHKGCWTQRLRTQRLLGLSQ